MGLLSCVCRDDRSTSSNVMEFIYEKGRKKKEKLIFNRICLCARCLLLASFRPSRACPRNHATDLKMWMLDMDSNGGEWAHSRWRPNKFDFLVLRKRRNVNVKGHTTSENTERVARPDGSGERKSLFVFIFIGAFTHNNPPEASVPLVVVNI